MVSDRTHRRSTRHIQHPAETPVQLCVYTFQIGDRHLLAKDHLVERSDKVRVQEAAVEDAETQAPADELEVVQVLRVHAGRGVDLQRVVVVRGILKQAVEGVEHLVREQEEEFPVRHRSEFIAKFSERATHLERPP